MAGLDPADRKLMLRLQTVGQVASWNHARLVDLQRRGLVAATALRTVDGRLLRSKLWTVTGTGLASLRGDAA